ncbi:MAG TPA: carbamoyl-phosphate synthase large subunit [Persephonella sp.]|uniref:Carbamoyl-phosphate synthase large chain (Carbamoyl-phosphate synthetase ammonia chain) n=1 Tax=Persephonella marina (strain DSM 14350 / EX-H1) TaxID=123214 RepID=C0QQG1_PERMH|nr:MULTISPECIES: carbamoyl-phosphate synthase large subunit [Persephonella]ACO03764.1 carbamoyl-phosphate synthase large chain (Carbamoyl-phosphate synthetase ammonia chain) [Persephonella marina EX-H1]HCB69487.1 carbamoyl-phosphate synthase large subunit [Persephonella sp.]
MKKGKIIILGSGPNRIGQGIEFDYACVHCVWALKEEGYEAIMVNCNPETVSTDYDTSDKLFFEPIVYEDVINIIESEKPVGVVVQFGGQTPLKLAVPLQNAGVNILGTSPDSIDIAEDRERFRNLVIKLGLKQPESGIARSKEEAIIISEKIGYPVLVRPSYVLGGRAMRLVYDTPELLNYIEEAVYVTEDKPLLIDRFLEDAIELDVDAVSDGDDVLVGAIMEHIEEAGIHSGDSATCIPPYTLSDQIMYEVKRQTRMLAKALNVKGLMNVQFAVKDDEVYIIEVNPRASRTVPFVSKAIGYPLAKIASKVIVGRKLKDILPDVFDIKETHPATDFQPKEFKRYSIKEVVFPWNRFPEVDPLLGPEMKSTGEVMGIDEDFGLAYYKAQAATGSVLPTEGNIFISVADRDKPQIVELARGLIDLGFNIFATKGTHSFLKEHGIDSFLVNKLSEERPNIVDRIRNGEIKMIINTPSGKRERSDAYYIRRAAVEHKIPYFTTVRAAYASLEAIRSFRDKELSVKPLQEMFQE